MDEADYKRWVMCLYIMRQERRSHPEGDFDRKRCWYPSARENCDDVEGVVRGPTANWPYTYMLRARRKIHCRTLVSAALAGLDVPPDVWEACPIRERFQPGTDIRIVRDYVIEGCPAL